MACVGSDIYLAVQDLARDFNHAPRATVAKSTDRGLTWSWPSSKPMFDDGACTTIFFLDAGKATADPLEYVYAFCLDYNWRDSYTDVVEDPTALFMARVPPRGLQDAAQWQWYGGTSEGGSPTWAWSVEARSPVLSDRRRTHQGYFNGPVEFEGQDLRNFSVISQGGVVYLPLERRYVYSSWSKFTHEFYEAAEPWGPYSLFFSRDYGRYPWTQEHSGGYAPTIPSKFIEPDGRMLVQSNTFEGGANNYGFSLREFRARF
jgi:hypothetical protein